eukprot:2851393-Lingulodinium_polyedra.AAC.1
MVALWVEFAFVFGSFRDARDTQSKVVVQVRAPCHELVRQIAPRRACLSLSHARSHERAFWREIDDFGALSERSCQQFSR